MVPYVSPNPGYPDLQNSKRLVAYPTTKQQRIYCNSFCSGRGFGFLVFLRVDSALGKVILRQLLSMSTESESS